MLASSPRALSTIVRTAVVALVSLLTYFPTDSFAQQDTEFWFVAPRTWADHDPTPSTFKLVSGNYANTHVTIRRPADSGNGWVDLDYDIGPNDIEHVVINDNLLFPREWVNRVPDQVTQYGILIESDNPITAYYENSYGLKNPDIFALKGQNALGTEFVTPFQNMWENVEKSFWGWTWAEEQPTSGFDIVATEDNTEIFVVPTQAVVRDGGGQYNPGDTIRFTLNRGETYRIKANDRWNWSHLAGSYISSNKPIAVTTWDDSVHLYNGAGQQCGDLVGDQMIPTSIVGTEYATVMGITDIQGGLKDQLIIQPIEDNTFITITLSDNSTQSGTYGRSNAWEFNLNQNAARIVSDKPVYVFQISGNGCEVGGAFIPPLNDCTGSQDVGFVRTPQFHASNRFALNIVVQGGSEGNFTTSGGSFAINSWDFQDVPGTGGAWKYMRREFSTGEIPVSQSMRITNSTGLFHLGLANGENEGGGVRFGYFSSFSNFDLGSTDILCSGNTIDIDAGSEPTAYLWSTGETTQSITVSNAGTYYITATLSTGCQGTDEVEITAQSGPVVDLGADFDLCSGSATLDAGNPGSTYTWSTGANTQTININSAGTYHVTATGSNTCSTRDTIVASANSTPSASLSNAAICAGESLTLNGGTGSAYLWSTGATTQTIDVSTAGSYAVTISNGSCSAAASMTLTVNSNPSVTLNDGAICSGSSLTLNAGAGYTYAWSTGANSQTIDVSTAGNYSVTITDGNTCSGSDDMTLTVNNNPTVTLNDAAICAGGATTLDAGAGYTYNWSNGSNAQTINVSAAGGYAVTITDGNTCTASDNMTLTVNSNPSVTLNNAAICAGESQLLDAGAGFTYAWTTGANSQTISPTTAGNYGVTITDGNSCSASDDMTLTVNSNPTVTLNDAAICAGSSQTLNAGAGYTYAWSTGANSQTINVNSAGNYSVTITDGNTCQGSDDMTLTVNSNPSVTLNDAAICDGASTTLDAGAGFSYNWSTGANTQTINISSAGNYAVTITDGNSCVATDDMDLTINSNPSVTLNDQAICAGSSTQLNAGAGFLYNWSTGANDQMITVNTAGNYEVTITDGNGCTDSDDMTLTVNSNPSVTLNDAAICQGETETIDAGAGFSYNWSNGANTQTIDATLAATYSVTITDGNGCTDSDNMTLTVNSNPTVNLTDGAVCDGDSQTLDAGAGYTYNWSTGANSQTINISTAGNYAVTITDGNGCTDSDDMNLTVNANLVVNLSDAEICAGETYTINPGTGGSYNYSWSNGANTETIVVSTQGTYDVTVTDGNSCTGSDGMNLTVHSNPSVTLSNDEICAGQSMTLNAGAGFDYAWSTGNNTQTININSAGNYSVTITDGNGCTDSDDMTLTVNANPTVTLDDAAVCAGATTNLNAGAGYTYNWTTGSNDQIITVGTAGYYEVEITDGNGCTDTDGMNLTVYTNPTVNLNDIAICDGQATTLDAGAGFTYNWTTGAATRTILVSTANTYGVTITDGNGCTDTDDMTLTVNANPTVTLNDGAVCSGDQLALNAGAGFTYNWTTGANSQAISVGTAGSYGVTITDGNGCEGSDDMTLTVYNNPSVTLSDAAVCSGFTTTLDGGAGFTYTWSTGSNNQTIDVGTAGNYAVTITDGNNCQASDDMNLTVNGNPTVVLNDAAVCSGSSTTLNAGVGFTYNWSTGANTQTISIQNANTYGVTITDGNGCRGTDDMTLTVNANPVPVLDDEAICDGASTTLSADAGYDYLWSTGLVTQTINVSAAGSYGVTITDGNGCSGSDDMTLSLNANPVVVLNDAEICDGSSLTLDAGAGYSYAWTTGVFNQSISVSTSGTYGVTITDGNGCSGSDDMTLTVHDNPIIDITNQAICAGESTTVNAGPGFDYNWSTGATTQIITVSAAGTYTAVVTDGNNCSSTDNMTLTVNALPVVTLNDLSICEGSSTNIDAGSNFSYEWSNTATTQGISITQPGDYHVTITDVNGCQDRDTMTLGQYTVPVVTNFNRPCDNTATTFTIEFDIVNGDPGSYSVNNIAGTLTGSSYVSDPLASGSSYNFTVTDVNGCGPVSAVAGSRACNCITDAGTLADITPMEICGPGSVSVQSNLDHTPDGDDVLMYVIHNSPNAVVAQVFDTSLTGDFTFDPAKLDYELTYYVSAVVGNDNGDGYVTLFSDPCLAVSEGRPVIFHALPEVNLAQEQVCTGEVESVSAGSFAAYNWSNGATTPTTTFDGSAPYSVTVTDNNGCTDRDTATMNVLALPIIDMADVEICQGETGIGTAPSGFFYNWSTTAISQSIILTTVGNYAVTVTDVNGCVNSDDFDFIIHDLPVFDVVNDTVCIGATGTLTAPAFAGYQWSTGATTQSINVSNPQGYLVTVTDANGCSQDDDVSLINYDRISANRTMSCNGTNTAFTLTFELSGGDATSYMVNGTPINGSTWVSPSITNGDSYQFVFRDGIGCDSVVVESSGNVSCDCSTAAGEMTSTATMEFCGPESATASYDGNSSLDADDVVAYILHDHPSNLGNVISISATPTFDFVDGTMQYETFYYISAVVGNEIGVGLVDLNDPCLSIAPGVPVVFHALPTPSIDDRSICQGSQTTIDAGSFASYNWTTGAQSQGIVVSTAGTYGVTVTNVNGCQAADDMTLALLDLPVVNIDDMSICPGTDAVIDAGIHTSYLWNTGVINQTISTQTPGNYVVTVTNADGCSASDNMNLVVFDQPVLTLDDAVICDQDVYFVDAGTFADYQWSDGPTTPTRTLGAGGTYIVSVTDNNGCQTSTGFDLTVNPLPAPAINSLDACARLGVALSLSESYAFYDWSTGAKGPTAITTGDGGYSVTVTDFNGCVGSTADVFEVFEAPTVTASVGDPNLCEGEDANMTVNIIDPAGNGPYTMDLVIGGETISYNGLVEGDNDIVIVAPQTSSISVTQVVASAGCAIDNDEMQISLPDIIVTNVPRVEVTSGGASCENGTGGAFVNFQMLHGEMPWLLTYEYNGQLVRHPGLTQPGLCIENAEAGTYELIQVIDKNGCYIDPADMPVPATIEQAPVPETDADVIQSPACDGVEFYLEATGSDVLSTGWVANGDTIWENPATLMFDYSTKVDIRMLVKSEYCSNSTDISDELGDFESHLTLNEQNVFTPNEDGVNDYFEMDPESYYSECSDMKIFNRWGTLIYHAPQGESGWDGVGLQGDAPEGTYYVIFDIAGYGVVNRSLSLFR